MANPFYKSQVLDNPNGTVICKAERCSHPHRVFRINQDCIEIRCSYCDHEIDFMCIGDVDDQTALSKIYDIIKKNIR